MSDVHILQSPQQLAVAFRSILRSFSKPAMPTTIVKVEGAPPPLFPTTAVIGLTLFDYQTPIWLSANLNTDAVRKFLRFQTGAPLTADPTAATFAILTLAETEAEWPNFNPGSHEYPDRSTSVILQVSSLTTGDAVRVLGPGLKDPVDFHVAKSTPNFWQHIQMNNSLFPIGNDFMFASPDAMAALPRSSRIAMLEHA
jgi:alpha-D-ribose 1-methylphosphonate 5-triphosphate synthase subunit PhnH